MRVYRSWYIVLIILVSSLQSSVLPLYADNKPVQKEPYSILDLKGQVRAEGKGEDGKIEKPKASLNGRLVQRIKIIGNSKIPERTALSYLGIELGKKYEQSSIDLALKNLYVSGFFEDIKITHQADGLLKVTVVENPSVNMVRFDGNKGVEDKELLPVVRLKPRSIYSAHLVDRDTQSILTMYQRRGWFAARVEPKLINVGGDKVNIVYTIDEGKKAKIKKIKFTGNEAFSDAVLRSVILSQEYRMYRFFSSVDLYDVNRMMADRDLLQSFYKSHGYVDFQATDSVSQITPERDAFFVTYVLTEGKQYKIKDIKIKLGDGIAKVKAEELMLLVPFKSGSIFNQSLIEESVERIKFRLGEVGYAFADVDYAIERVKEDGAVNITFKIDESPKMYINKINILENFRTKDKVIRREMRVEEGDSFNSRSITRSRDRLLNLGYFKDVKFEPKKTNVPDKLDLDITVKEQSTGSMKLGGGYDSGQGLIGTLGITENNLLGTGNIVEAQLMMGQTDSSLVLGFTDPYFMDKNFAAGVDVFFNKQRIKGDLDQKTQNQQAAKGIKESGTRYSVLRIGATAKMGYELGDYLSQKLRYSIISEDTKKGVSALSPIIIAEQGESLISAVGQTLSYDRRDSRMEPTRGYMLQLEDEISGLGGNAPYIKNILRGSVHVPIYKQSVVLHMMGQIGNISAYGSGHIVRVADSFFLGNDEIRGFEWHGIGPRDKNTDDALGGKNFYMLSTELNFPIGFPDEIRVKGAAFVDMGSLFDIDIPKTNPAISKDSYYNSPMLRVSCGVGVVWNSPMGRLRFDYGIALRRQRDEAAKKDVDQVQRIRIKIGTETLF